MSEIVLKAERREGKGRRVTRRIRKEGNVPGVYYYHNGESFPVTVDAQEFFSVVQSDANVVELDFGKGKPLPTIVREVQWDPVTSQPIHVDFMGVALDEKVSSEVPIHLIGTSIGVKDHGGILQFMQRSIEVEALPLDLPDSVDIDISNLDLHQSLHISDVTLEKGTILSDPDTVIVTVLPPALAEGEEEGADEAEAKVDDEETGKTEETDDD